MVQIQEASRTDLMVRMIAAAARDHGPAVFVVGPTVEELLVADAILRHRLPVDIVAVGPEAPVLRDHLIRLYDLGLERIRTADTLERAVLGKLSCVTPRRGAAGNPLPPYEYDAARGMLRFNPLAGWSEADVRAYADAESVERLEPTPHSHARPADACRLAA